ncbi:MAG: FHA domain-containing protein [bacterium]|nr:FHA domain-containing protein [bacterium]
MSTNEWSCPDANEHGFVPFDVLKQKAAALTREQFLGAFPQPALLSVYPGAAPEQGSEPVDPTDSGFQLLTVAIKSATILRYLGKVAFIAKRPGNPFGHLISVGRSASNDITLAVDSVSKVHGYFVRDGDLWSFTDHGSTNGSTVSGREIAAGDKCPLFDGSVLQLGIEAMLEYLSPESLYDRASRG